MIPVSGAPGDTTTAPGAGPQPTPALAVTGVDVLVGPLVGPAGVRHAARVDGRAPAPGTAVLRCAPVAESFAALAAAAAVSAAVTGILTAPLGDRRWPLVALRDVTGAAARVAAESAADLAAGRPDRHAGATYHLHGDTLIGGADIAALLAWLLDRPVRYAPSPGDPPRTRHPPTLGACCPRRLPPSTSSSAPSPPRSPPPSAGARPDLVVGRARRLS
ncbi:hypothetical protein GCM10009827_025050 [Dactylosporangium maewongense]|uniref:Uncharacterized protein n=1 Tax=Dactylosporangium maewongense TaxID=634393 RepID=A0ABN2A315_9ACTN